MPVTATPLGDLLRVPRYFPRLTEGNTRGVERALAGDLFTEAATVDGAVVEAAFAATEHPVLDHLRAARVPLLIDPQTLRLTVETYRSNTRLGRLPYLPAAPITPATPAAERDHFVAEVLRFQAKAGAGYYLTPGVPLHDPAWTDLNRDLAVRTAAANGREVDYRDLVTVLAPAPSTLRTPKSAIAPLLDLPVTAAYVQPLTLDPGRDSVDKLAGILAFHEALAAADLPTIAGRVGAFGLVLQCLGVPGFDSGLGVAERYSWTDQTRPPSPRGDTSTGGGAGKRVYLAPLMTTVPAAVADTVFRIESVRGRYVCNHPCCAGIGQSGLADRRQEHYLFTRTNEVQQLRARPTQRLRLHDLYQSLLAARDLAAITTTALRANPGPGTAPSFAHLDTWLGLIARAHQDDEPAPTPSWP